ncbi:coiled-coil domain-containing protein 175 isoform X1 [Danio rerio]|uniref:Coiled-coil domain-containing 175 n=1 Tax=Danio rerio TaxID=7955 RepID=X1WGC2_DANRE|nr:myosin-2 heavy chain [Danio rerio]|eukprot:XP_005158711.1 myosin-2 heavy chain [Danio rerio]
MATCLVPDFPAVRIVLEHLSELDKRLREEGVSFSQEASHHLTETAEAIKELESARKAARERLEVETIETSKLRHRKVNLQDDIKREIAVCVTAARESNATALNRLRSELKAAVDDIQSMEDKQQLIEQENAALLQGRENITRNYEDAVDQLNQMLSKKVDTQMLLKEKQNEIQSLKDKIAQVEMAQQILKENRIQRNKIFTESKHSVQKELEQIVLKIKEQRKINAETRRETDSITSELQDKEDTVTQCENHISQLEKNIAKLTASKVHCQERLHKAIGKTEELECQKEFHERELLELAEAFEQKVQAIQEQIEKIENELGEEQKVKSALSEQCAKLSDIFSAQSREEDDMIAEQNSLSKRLEESKQIQDEDIISIAKLKYAIKNIKRETGQLHDANIISADVFRKSTLELEGQLAKHNISRPEFEAEREKIRQSLKTLKEEHEQHVKEMNTAIEQTQKRYEELLKEEKKLQDHTLLNSVIEGLTNELTSTEEDGKQMETNYQAELQQLTREAESITQTQMEKEQELKVQESSLEMAESQFDTERLKHQTLKRQISELENQKNHLELSVQKITRQTAALIQPKDDLKRELMTLREKHMEMLTANAAEINAVETNIYENGVMLERVMMENSRLHVCIELMKEEIMAAKKDKEKYIQEAEWMNEEVQSIFKSLIDTWTTDVLFTEESADQDQKIVEDINSLLERIQERKHHIGNINNKLEKELVGIRSMLEKTNYKSKDIELKHLHHSTEI